MEQIEGIETMKLLLIGLKKEEQLSPRDSAGQWLLLPIFLLIATLCILPADVKTALSEETRIANIDHDIDDLIDSTKNKYRPDRNSNPRSSRREAEIPRDTRRRQESRQDNSQPNRQLNRKRS